MRIAISISEQEALDTLDKSDPISGICYHIAANDSESVLIPHPGKLMDLIKILKENNIAYRVIDVPSDHSYILKISNERS